MIFPSFLSGVGTNLMGAEGFIAYSHVRNELDAISCVFALSRYFLLSGVISFFWQSKLIKEAKYEFISFAVGIIFIFNPSFHHFESFRQ